LAASASAQVLDDAATLMHRVLLVSYYFPPLGGIGSTRAASFAYHLPEFGWEPLLVAPRATPHAQDGQPRFRPDVRTSIELRQLGKVLPAAPGGTGGRRGNVRAPVRSAAHRSVFCADAQIGWSPGAVSTGPRALRRYPVDVVHSSSFPITAHLVGRTLSRQAVTEFRDPWSDTLPEDHPYAGRTRRLERRLGTAADSVVMPTPTLTTHFERRWKREVVLTNGFDAVQAPPPSDRPVVTYLGSYYAGRQSLVPVRQGTWFIPQTAEASGERSNGGLCTGPTIVTSAPSRARRARDAWPWCSTARSGRRGHRG